MAGLVKDVPDVAAFHQFPGVHDAEVIADAGYDPQVVGDEDIGGLKVMFQFFQQIQDRGLHRHIQRRGGFIHDQEGGIVQHSHGNDHALLLPARDLMGEASHYILGVRHVHPSQHLHGTIPGLVPVSVPVESQDLYQLVPYPHGRVEGLHGVLEHHRNPVASQLLELVLRPANQILPLKMDLTSDDLPVGTEKIDDPVSDGALAASGLAHQADRFSLPDRERDIPDGLDIPPAGLVGDGELIDLNDRFGIFELFHGKAAQSLGY
jgi:hypothetical protein